MEGKTKKVKKYRKRKYNPTSFVIYTKEKGFIAECKTEEDAILVLNALNKSEE